MVAVLSRFPTSSEQGLLHFTHLSSICFFSWYRLTGVIWNLRVVSICISMMAKDIKHLKNTAICLSSFENGSLAHLLMAHFIFGISFLQLFMLCRHQSVLCWQDKLANIFTHSEAIRSVCYIKLLKFHVVPCVNIWEYFF